MSTTTYTRNAKCKDCIHIRYFYKGKRKLHLCDVFEMQVCLNDNIGKECAESFFSINPNYWHQKLDITLISIP